jgi:hypothetical protein
MLARETGGVHDVAHEGTFEWVPPPIQAATASGRGTTSP